MDPREAISEGLSVQPEQNKKDKEKKLALPKR